MCTFIYNSAQRWKNNCTNKNATQMKCSVYYKISYMNVLFITKYIWVFFYASVNLSIHERWMNKNILEIKIIFLKMVPMSWTIQFVYLNFHRVNICTIENSYILMNKHVKYGKASNQNTLLYQCKILFDLQKNMK